MLFDRSPLMPLAIALRLALLPPPPLLTFPTTNRRLASLFDHLLTVFKAVHGLTNQHGDKTGSSFVIGGNPG